MLQANLRSTRMDAVLEPRSGLPNVLYLELCWVDIAAVMFEPIVKLVGMYEYGRRITDRDGRN